jgi:hypothetical protein
MRTAPIARPQKDPTNVFIENLLSVRVNSNNRAKSENTAPDPEHFERKGVKREKKKEK